MFALRVRLDMINLATKADYELLAIFVLRTMALWNNSKKLAVLLFLFLAGVTVGYIVILILFFEGIGCEFMEVSVAGDIYLKLLITVAPSPLPGLLTGCTITKFKTNLWPIYVLLLGHESGKFSRNLSNGTKVANRVHSDSDPLVRQAHS